MRSTTGTSAAVDLLEGGNPEAAAELLAHARAQAPDSASVLEALARALFDARRYAEAATRFTELVEASPDNDYARFGLGLTKMRLGDAVGAVEQLAMAATDAPGARGLPAGPARGPGHGPGPGAAAGERTASSAGSPAPLATRHDVALLDLDGVLYVGPDAVPGAAGVAGPSRGELGLRCAFVTNNASRTPERVAEHLARARHPGRARATW